MKFILSKIEGYRARRLYKKLVRSYASNSKYALYGRYINGFFRRKLLMYFSTEKLASGLIEQCRNFDLSQLDNPEEYPDAADDFATISMVIGEALVCMGSKAIKPLLASLNHEKEYVTSMAIRCLGHIGGQDSVTILREMAQAAEMKTRQQTVVAKYYKNLLMALADQKDQLSLPLMKKALTTIEGKTNENWLRRIAAQAIGKVGQREAIALLKDILFNDPDKFVCYGAAQGLLYMKDDPEVQMILKQALCIGDRQIAALLKKELRIK